jgi:hypothetical protein
MHHLGPRRIARSPASPGPGRSRLLAVCLLAPALAALAACGPKALIPGTKIVDTPQNRDVIGVIERYRRAMERKDVPTLVALAHRDYFENGGSNGPEDDYGYEGLIRVLRERMQRVKAIRYGIEYRRLTIKGDRALVEVFIDGSFQLGTPDGADRWTPKKDYHRFVLLRTGARWQMLSGM